MGLLQEMIDEVVKDFSGMTETIVDELSGDADEILLRRLRTQYDNIPIEALVAIRDNLGKKANDIIADEEFKRSEEFD